jgi:hypothetical protein
MRAHPCSPPLKADVHDYINFYNLQKPLGALSLDDLRKLADERGMDTADKVRREGRQGRALLGAAEECQRISIAMQKVPRGTVSRRANPPACLHTCRASHVCTRIRRNS